MSTEECEQEERFAQLRRVGFVDVDQWDVARFDEVKQQQLLAVLRNDPLATKLE